MGAHRRILVKRPPLVQFASGRVLPLDQLDSDGASHCKSRGHKTGATFLVFNRVKLSQGLRFEQNATGTSPEGAENHLGTAFAAHLFGAANLSPETEQRLSPS